MGGARGCFLPLGYYSACPGIDQKVQETTVRWGGLDLRGSLTQTGLKSVSD